jgi:hypothetical protein
MWNWLDDFSNQIFVFVLFVELGLFVLAALDQTNPVVFGAGIWGGFLMLALRGLVPLMVKLVSDKLSPGRVEESRVFTERA